MLEFWNNYSFILNIIIIAGLTYFCPRLAIGGLLIMFGHYWAGVGVIAFALLNTRFTYNSDDNSFFVNPFHYEYPNPFKYWKKLILDHKKAITLGKEEKNESAN